mmetsp:Transcript_20205/g.43976  ORF Transcript_20205/g.43976 Transcript_20205/m.43976 type:complete len:721 (-) Transcript_20205:259-2421(-)
MAPFPLSVFDDHHQRNRNQQKRMQRQHQNKHKRNHQQHQHQIMELKTYKDFKKQLVAKSKATSSSTRKMDKNCNDNINKRSIPSDFNSYPHDDLNSAEDRSSSNGKKRMKIPGRSHPLSLPVDGVGYNENNVNDNITGGSNNSFNRNITKHNHTIDNVNQARNSVPFSASNWWKKGNDHVRELMATSLVLPNEDDDIAATFATFVADANKKYETTSTSSDKDASNRSPVTASTASTSSSAVAESYSVPFPTPELAAVSAKQQRYFQLLGEVATSGSSNHHFMNIHHQTQHPHPEFMHTHINRTAKNNPQAYHSKHIFASQSSARYPSILDKQPNTNASTQPFLPLGQSLDVDPSIFPIDQMGTRTMMPSQFRQQHHQSLHRLPSDHASTSFHSTQSAYFQQYLHRAQRQKIREPGVIRAETVSVDEIRSSGDITEVSHSPAVERELEESFREDTTFDEEVGKSGANNNNAENKTNGTHIRRKDSIAASVDDDHLIFSDIKVDAIDSDCVNVEGVDVEVDVAVLVGSGNHLDDKRSSNRSHTTPNSPLKPNLELELNSSGKVKFRAYQAENWTEKFDELLKFREETGHCLVPNSHPQNPALAQWTKRQRYQYKLKQEGKRSTITDERVRALEEAGFIWDSHKAVWSERLEELKSFKREFNHCNVPSRYQRNHQLAIWVKRQRRQWKNKMDQLSHCMTDERQQALEAVGFVWDMKKKKTQGK